MLSRKIWQASLHRWCFIIDRLLPRIEWRRSKSLKIRIGWPCIHRRNWGTVKRSHCNWLLQFTSLKVRLRLHLRLSARSVSNTSHGRTSKGLEFRPTAADEILVRFIAFFCSFVARRSERRSSRPLFLYHSSNSDNSLLASDSVWERICNLKRFERWDLDDICVSRWETSENRGCFGQRLHSKGMELLGFRGMFKAVTRYQSQHKEDFQRSRGSKTVSWDSCFICSMSSVNHPLDLWKYLPLNSVDSIRKWRAAVWDKDSFERLIGAIYPIDGTSNVAHVQNASFTNQSMENKEQ